MGNTSWKHFERTVAKRLGGVRMGPTGRTTNDVDHPEFAVECKYLKAIPDWLVKAMNQAKINSSCDKKTPVLFLKRPRTREKDDLVCMYASDFYDWFGVDARKVNDKGHDEE